MSSFRTKPLVPTTTKRRRPEASASSGAPTRDDTADTQVTRTGLDAAKDYTTTEQDAPGGVGDRSVTFTNNVVGIAGAPALTSKGEAVTFVLEPDGTRLVGYAGQRAVIEISLSDDGAGSYRVALLDQIDHPPGGSENDIVLTLNFTATDSDGDTAGGVIRIGIDDDVPVAMN